jgi:hypothetical protein
MSDKKKREKVVAEISLAHLMQLAAESRLPASRAEVTDFLNQNGNAYAMWKQMMQAGEEYFRKYFSRESQRRLPLPKDQSPAAGERRRIAV